MENIACRHAFPKMSSFKRMRKNTQNPKFEKYHFGQLFWQSGPLWAGAKFNDFELLRRIDMQQLHFQQYLSYYHIAHTQSYQTNIQLEIKPVFPGFLGGRSVFFGF